MSTPEGPGPGSRHQAKVLVVEAGPAAGTVLSFTDQLRLGRGESGGDLGGDAALSRCHAVLRAGPGGITIEDLGSTNGTFLNGSRISGVRQVRLGDTVEVGDSRLRLSADSGEATALPRRYGPPPASLRGGGLARDDIEETGWAPAGPPAADQRVQRTAAPQKRGPWTGTVSAVDHRTDQLGSGKKSFSKQVLTFRLTQFAESGDRRAIITVELRGREFTGDVAAGDQVRAYGRLKGGVIRAKRVHNLTTGGIVRVVSHIGRQLVKIAIVVCLLLVILAAALYAAHRAGL